MKHKTEMLEIVIAMLQQQPRFGFTLGFQDRLMPHSAALLNGCSKTTVGVAGDDIMFHILVY